MPGSAKWGRVEFGDDAGHGASATAKAPTQFREKDAVTIAARPGDTLFFGPYTAHASFENRSDRYRRILINGYACPGANHRVYPGKGAGRRLTAPNCPRLNAADAPPPISAISFRGGLNELEAVTLPR
jgi:hypothetical protein